MKRNLLVSLSLTGLLALSSCKKKDDGNNACGSYGGVVGPNTYLFWINQDFCGPITVEVKNKDGQIVPAFQNMILYTAAVPPDCNNVNYNKYATFDLYQGRTYTYKAACSGKTWSGTINVPCEQNQCKSIQLQ